MADHYNLYEMKQFARTVADCMDFPLPEDYAPGIHLYNPGNGPGHYTGTGDL